MLISVAGTVSLAEEILPNYITATYNGIETTKIKTTAANLLGLIRNSTVIASVVIISILGLKYMIGSTEERAEYKKSFMPLIIGIVVVLGASQMATMISSTFQ